MTILAVVQLSTGWTILDDILGLIPKDIAKGGRWAMYPYALPPFLLLCACVQYLMYQEKSKKEILAYFEKMPAKRQRIGKACSIIYNVSSVVMMLTTFYFVVEAKKIPVDEDKQHQEYLESLWADPCTKDSWKVDTVEQFDIIKQ